MLLVVAPLHEELKAGMIHYPDILRVRKQGVVFWESPRQNGPICFLRAGVGPRRSAANLEKALAAIRPSRILVVGYAGAIDPDLRLGDLVAVARAVSLSLDKLHPDWSHARSDGSFELADSETLARVGKSIGLRTSTGDALTSAHILGNPIHKQLLRDAFHGSIVDMETAALARIAASRSVPLSCLRVVSDVVEDTFLQPFSYDPAAGIPARARKLLNSGMVHAYREWRNRAAAAQKSLRRFLAHYLGGV